MTLLLPPAPPEVERYELAKERFAFLRPSALRAAQSFSKAIEPVLDALRQLCDALNGIGFFSPPPHLQPTIRYQLAGSPYGHNTRGKKRWLLEQKRRR